MTVYKKKYYLYIDDSGSRFPDHQNTECRRDGMDHFALGGVLVAEEDKRSIAEAYQSFCDDWNISYPLHSSDIRGMRNDFAWLESSAKQKDKFLSELEAFLVSLPVVGFAAVVHRPGYNARYEERYGDKRWWMCKTAYSILIERVTKYVRSLGGVLEVRFEECGKKEDRALAVYAKALKNDGHPFNIETSARYDGLSCESYRQTVLGEPRRKKKSNLYIQIADLYLYPMAKRKYEPTYNPWVVLYENKKVVDALLEVGSEDLLGIKYSCFDDWESKRPGKTQT
jgi:hypothetical protein